MAKNQKDTCNWGGCYFSQLFDKRDQCPYFHQLHWLPQDGGQPYATDDCAAKKTMLMVQELFTRLIGVQQASEQERNASHALVSEMANIIAIVQAKPMASVQIFANQKPQIENRKDG